MDAVGNDTASWPLWLRLDSGYSSAPIPLGFENEK